jgi:hypothetical protein
MFDLLNAADYEGATRALDGLEFPVPTVDAWYGRQSFTREEWVAARDNADSLTRRFLVECGRVTSAAQRQDPRESGEDGEEADR